MLSRMLSSLEPGDWLTLSAILLVLLNLFRARKVRPPMTPEWRTFWIEFIKNNTGIAWSWLASLVFMWALFHATHDHLDNPVVETFKTLLAGSVGWMGGMLTGRAGRAADITAIPVGSSGSQDITTHIDVLPPKPIVATDPIVVQKIEEPVTVKSEDK